MALLLARRLFWMTGLLALFSLSTGCVRDIPLSLKVDKCLGVPAYVCQQANGQQRGESSSVLFTVFELSGAPSLVDLSPGQLFSDPQGALGDYYVSQLYLDKEQVISLYSNQSNTFALTVSKECTHLLFFIDGGQAAAETGWLQLYRRRFRARPIRLGVKGYEIMFVGE